jgi:hypothetical protein
MSGRETPNAVERVTGVVGAGLAIPTLLPIAAMMGLVTRFARGEETPRWLRPLRPVVFALVFLFFCVTMVVFIPWMLIVRLLMVAGLIRPQAPETDDEGEE